MKGERGHTDWISSINTISLAHESKSSPPSPTLSAGASSWWSAFRVGEERAHETKIQVKKGRREEGEGEEEEEKTHISVAAATASSTPPNPTTAHLVGNNGASLNVASVTIPSVPSAPMNSFVVSNPALDFRALWRVLITSPEGNTTV